MTKDETLRMALEALEAMQMYAEAERKGLRICDEAITAIKAALEAKDEPVELNITIDDDDALAYLRDMVVQSDGDLTPIRLVVWGGHSGYGLYIASADYPEEGAIKIADVAANPPAAHQPWVGLTDEEIYLCTNHIDRNLRGRANKYARAIEAVLRSKNT